MEVWKTVKGFENYEISNLGRVKSFCRNRKGLLLSLVYSRGYLVVGVRNNKGKKLKKVHRLVSLAFIDNPLNKPQVNHINGIKTDNHVDNLEWCTAKENTIHAYKIGLANMSGENNTRSVFTESQVLEIRALKKDFTFKELANKYNVSLGAIDGVVYRRTWKHI